MVVSSPEASEHRDSPRHGRAYVLESGQAAGGTKTGETWKAPGPPEPIAEDMAMSMMSEAMSWQCRFTGRASGWKQHRKINTHGNRPCDETNDTNRRMSHSAPAVMSQERAVACRGLLEQAILGTPPDACCCPPLAAGASYSTQSYPLESLVWKGWCKVPG